MARAPRETSREPRERPAGRPERDAPIAALDRIRHDQAEVAVAAAVGEPTRGREASRKTGLPGPRIPGDGGLGHANRLRWKHGPHDARSRGGARPDRARCASLGEEPGPAPVLAVAPFLGIHAWIARRFLEGRDTRRADPRSTPETPGRRPWSRGSAPYRCFRATDDAHVGAPPGASTNVRRSSMSPSRRDDRDVVGASTAMRSS